VLGEGNHDVATGVLAASLSKRPRGYTNLGFPILGASHVIEEAVS
jgi:hypothetical protein